MDVPELRAASLDEALARVAGKGAKLKTRRASSGGCINTCSELILDGGERLFLKENSARFPGMFEAEARGLLALARDEGPRVPKPLAWGENGAGQFLLMEFIPSGQRRNDSDREFGRALARLHARPMPYWGFDHDNYIGSTPQPNTRDDDGVRFFAQKRLAFQVRLARDRGLLSPSLSRKADVLIGKLGQWLAPVSTHPSILHGDLWSGNVMVDESGEAVMVDPAAYYGHREADLAMTELFGRLDGAFYDGYDEVLPRAPGYEDRRELFNLYHLLNHLNLFGSAYLAGVEFTLAHFTGSSGG